MIQGNRGSARDSRDARPSTRPEGLESAGGVAALLQSQINHPTLDAKAKQVGSVVGVLDAEPAEGRPILTSGDETRPDVKNRPTVGVLSDVETSNHERAIAQRDLAFEARQTLSAREEA